MTSPLRALRNARRGELTRWLTLWTVVFFSGMTGWIVWRVFGTNPPDVPAGTATAFSAFLASGLAGAWGLYKWARGAPEDNA